MFICVLSDELKVEGNFIVFVVMATWQNWCVNLKLHTLVPLASGVFNRMTECLSKANTMPIAKKCNSRMKAKITFVTA